MTPHPGSRSAHSPPWGRLALFVAFAGLLSLGLYLRLDKLASGPPETNSFAVGAELPSSVAAGSGCPSERKIGEPVDERPWRAAANVAVAMRSEWSEPRGSGWSLMEVP